MGLGDVAVVGVRVRARIKRCTVGSCGHRRSKPVRFAGWSRSHIRKQTHQGMCTSDSPLVVVARPTLPLFACLLSHSTAPSVQRNGGYPTCTSWHPAKVFSPIAVGTPPAWVAITPSHASCLGWRWAKTRASLPASAAPSLHSLAASWGVGRKLPVPQTPRPVPTPRPQSGVPCPQDEVLSLRP